MPDRVLKQHTGAIDKDATGLGDRDVAFILSTEDPDRDNDVIHQTATDAGRGWVLDGFKQNSVAMMYHDYRSLPIGRWDNVRVAGGALRGVLHFVEPELDNGRADSVLRLVKGGYLNAASVGFRPIVSAYNQERGGTDYYECELLEASVVPVPAQASALVEARSFLGESAWKSYATELVQLLDVAGGASIELRGAIPYRRTPLAPEGTAWDAGQEVAAASVDDLKIMCAYFASPGTRKSDFKLPHHHSSGSHACVWKAVANAAARLSQTSLPAGDIPGVKKHLAAHYRDFGKEAPWKSAPEEWRTFERAAAALHQTKGQLGKLDLGALLEACGFWSEADAVLAIGSSQVTRMALSQGIDDLLGPFTPSPVDEAIALLRADPTPLLAVVEREFHRTLCKMTGRLPD